MNDEKEAEKPLRILHLEDSPRDAEIIRERLIDAGFSMQMDWASNEHEFTSFLQAGGYDLVLADYLLPGFDAPAALVLTKSLCPGIPFIAVSGAIGEEKAVELLKQGATDYVLKDRLYKLPLAMERALDEVREQKARKQAEAALKRIEWMLSKKHIPAMEKHDDGQDQGYGDLTALNRDGVILKSVGRDVLRSISADYLDMLGTSSAIYEVNGDYAFGIFASNWCRMLDRASRKLCDTDDNVAALSSGQWLCHESCWTRCSKESIATRAPVDIECNGGIHLYGVPIVAGETVIGSINLGYGDIPKDPVKLRALANAYHLNYEDLLAEFNAYDSRPPYIVEMAKSRLHASARLIGILVERKKAEEELHKLNKELEQRVKQRTAELEKKNKELERMNKLFVGRELRMIELKETIAELKRKVAKLDS